MSAVDVHDFGTWVSAFPDGNEAIHAPKNHSVDRVVAMPQQLRDLRNRHGRFGLRGMKA